MFTLLRIGIFPGGSYVYDFCYVIVAFIRLLASFCAINDPVNVLQNLCLSAQLVELQYFEMGTSFKDTTKKRGLRT